MSSPVSFIVWKFTSDKGCVSHSAAKSGSAALDELRSAGWVVAIHNDYRQNGKLYTFWLMTHPNGQYLKGEGKTDCEALLQIAELRQKKEREQG